MFRVLSKETERELAAAARSVRELCDRLRNLEPLLLAQLIRGDSGGGGGMLAGLIRSLNHSSSQPQAPAPQ